MASSVQENAGVLGKRKYRNAFKSNKEEVRATVAKRQKKDEAPKVKEVA